MPGPMGGSMRRNANGMTQIKAKDFKKTTKKLIKDYLAKYKIALVIVLIFAIGSTIFTIVGPKILGNATTEIFNGMMSKISGGEGIDFGKVAGILSYRRTALPALGTGCGVALPRRETHALYRAKDGRRAGDIHLCG